jgi:hypothetical protein
MGFFGAGLRRACDGFCSRGHRPAIQRRTSQNRQNCLAACLENPKIVQENKSFRFHLDSAPTPFIVILRTRIKGLRETSALPLERAFARLPRGIGPALFLAYKVVLE